MKRTGKALKYSALLPGFLYFFLINLLIFTYSCTNNNISEWRGLERNGYYSESSLMQEWPEGGPDEVLLIENIGNGYGSPVIGNSRIFVTGEIDSTAILFCFDLSGNEIWKTELGPEWTMNFPGSRSAPTLVGDRLFVITGMGKLFCLSSDNGDILWSKDKEEFGGVLPYFGHSEAVLYDNDRIFWFVGGPENSIISLDIQTGELLWSQEAFGERSGYNSPRIIETASGRQVVGFSAYHLVSLDCKTGELLWSHEQTSYPPEEREPGKGDTHGNTVVYENGSIFYIAGDGNGGVRLDLSVDGKEVKEVWRNESLDGYMGGIVKIGDVLYSCGTRKKDLKSINCENGEVIESLNIGSGALIAADKRLYYYNQKGEMMLISYELGDMEIVSNFKIEKGSKEHFAHPVISDGILYVRHGNTLMGFNIKAV